MRKKDANPLENFDYLVGCEDFLLYELGRLIDEDRASLDDEEFRRVVDEGIREHLEAKAYALVRAMWPLPRHYIAYSLKSHTHEDLPFRWFQLMIDCEDPAAVDRILEEVLVHAENPDFREDLQALVELLRQSRDPRTEEKIMELL